uniref:Uncharacterized protein n=1 Tax=Globisporangium ultimum (strain ATCC 200006 / CBS 805.95 / DAOM BR144) TaxID=431595 RepID=K3W9X8_GLOUD
MVVAHDDDAQHADELQQQHDDPVASAVADTSASSEQGAKADDEHNEENEYGLQDLDRLPLLEQVHRLFHAIQMKYPYKETHAWKNLPVDQKKKMLEYIRDKRMRKKAASVATQAPAAAAESMDLATAKSLSTGTANTVEGVAAAPSPANPLAPAVAVRTDPYLQMLQRRTLTTTTSAASTSTPSSTSLPFNDSLDLAAHPNSAYIAPAQIAQYTERQNRKARWKVVDAEFYDEKCGACGVVHKEFDGAKGYLRTALSAIDPEELHAGAGLRTLVEVFHEEAMYYGRWREFRGESKHEQNELEDVEEEELAEELDLFAVSEADSVFNEAFLARASFTERIKFADERTKAMDWSIYDGFARGRKLNFMSSKGQQFRHWLHLGKTSRASLEFMNFVAYHNIGRLVEMAIKRRHNGVLQAMPSPLVKDDIQAVATAFIPLQ